MDKENSLTFQNITQTMKINRARKNGRCYQHLERTAKYRNKDTNELYCVSCAIQEASRGEEIEDLSKSQSSKQSSWGLNLLEDIFQQSQQQIHDFIQVYNCKYQKLLDAMTDMQIRDLISFNRKIQENQVVFKRLKNEMSRSLDRDSLLNVFSNQNVEPILSNITQLIGDLSVLETRNQQKSSRIRSKRVSPLPQSKSFSPQPFIRNTSHDISEEQFTLRISNNSFQGQNNVKSRVIRQSFTKSQTNTNSFRSKTSTIEEIKKSVLEDTPESVKERLNQSQLKLPDDLAVTMFEKIDVCESIDVATTEQLGINSMEKGSVSSLKRKDRYGNDSEL